MTSVPTAPPPPPHTYIPPVTDIILEKSCTVQVCVIALLRVLVARLTAEL